MRTFIFLPALLLTQALYAQADKHHPDPVFNGSTASVIQWRKFMNAKKFDEASTLCSKSFKKTEQEHHTFKTLPENFGLCLDALLADSTYDHSNKKNPLVSLNYISYYENALLNESFVLKKEKKKLVIDSYRYTPGYANYNDPFMHYGLERATGFFVEFINTGKKDDAYNLFMPGFSEAMPADAFNDAVDLVKEHLGNIYSLDLVDECSALLYRKLTESVAYGLFRVNGSTDTVYLMTSLYYENKVFYLRSFDFFSEYELDNADDIQEAGVLLQTLMDASKKNNAQEAYNTLHEDLQKNVTAEQLHEYLKKIDELVGGKRSYKVVDKLFCRSGRSLNDNEYVAIVQDEGELGTFIDFFSFGYNSRGQLKITYFYMNGF